MRILQVISTLGVGGAERMVASLARNLRRHGHAVAVVSLSGAQRNAVETALRSEDVSLHFLGARAGRAALFREAARVVADFRPDVIHTHLGAMKYAMAGWRRSRMIHTVHNLAEHDSAWKNRTLQWVAFRAGVVPVAIGEAVAATMRRMYGLSPCIIPNGIPVASFASPPAARDETRVALGIPRDAPTFVTVARLMPQKDHATLVRALASARLRDLDARCLIVGDGELRPSLERLADELEVRDRVRFLGVRADVPQLLAASDVFVLSSRFEGNPLAVMEAMAAGRPVVSTAVGCVPELVDARTGELVPPGSPGALEAAMFRLASDPALARTKGAAAAGVAAERFDESVMVSAYERLYAGAA
jgi:glycosyltransferase involved in cell wall biosynthesis